MCAWSNRIQEFFCQPLLGVELGRPERGAHETQARNTLECVLFSLVSCTHTHTHTHTHTPWSAFSSLSSHAHTCTHTHTHAHTHTHTHTHTHAPWYWYARLVCEPPVRYLLCSSADIGPMGVSRGQRSDALGECVHVCACVYMCVVCVHVGACGCICVHVCTCVYMWVHVCACVCMCVHVCACVCTCGCMCVHVCACVYMCVHVCTCGCMCVHVCACVYMCVRVCTVCTSIRVCVRTRPRLHVVPSLVAGTNSSAVAISCNAKLGPAGQTTWYPV